MKIVVCENYEEMSKVGANIIADLLKAKPDCILGLATGSTPVGMYKELTKMNKAGEITFKDVTSFNLDEYVGLPESHIASVSASVVTPLLSNHFSTVSQSASELFGNCTTIKGLISSSRCKKKERNSCCFTNAFSKR